MCGVIGGPRRLLSGAFRCWTPERNGRARRPARSKRGDFTSECLPVAAGRAAAVALVGAGTRDLARARVLMQNEHAAVLRRRRDIPALRGVRRDAHRRVRRGTDRETGVAELGRRVAVVVVLLVGVARLDLRDRVTTVRLGIGVLALLLLTQEGRQSDGGKDADDQNDDQELDEREALLLVDALAELPQHGEPSLGTLVPEPTDTSHPG